MFDTRRYRGTSHSTDRSLRVKRYLVAAAGMAAATGAADAAVIRSSDQPGWTAQTLSGVGVNSATSRLTDFRDAKLNKAFVAVVGVNLFRATAFGGEFLRAGVFNNAGVGGYAGAFFKSRLGTGAAIGASRVFVNDMAAAGSFEKSGDPWVPNDRVPAAGAYTGPWSLGILNSADSVRGYLGFQFNDGTSNFYGYFDVEVARNGRGKSSSTFSMTIHGWAYDDSGAPITISAPVAVPGGAGLASLAVGALGLRGRRRSRSA